MTLSCPFPPNGCLPLAISSGLPLPRRGLWRKELQRHPHWLELEALRHSNQLVAAGCGLHNGVVPAQNDPYRKNPRRPAAPIGAQPPISRPTSRHLHSLCLFPLHHTCLFYTLIALWVGQPTTWLRTSSRGKLVFLHLEIKSSRLTGCPIVSIASTNSHR